MSVQSLQRVVPSHPLPRVSSTFQLPVARLVEVSGTATGARFSYAVAALLQAQAEGEPGAWIQLKGGGLYPPDLAEAGVDLQALAVVHIPVSEGDYGLLRAAELLLRSGAMGIVIVDLGRSALRPTDTAWQGRLLGLARQHQSRVLLLTERSGREGSLGPLVSLRVEARRQRTARGVFSVESFFIKNKSGCDGHGASMMFRGPWGLR